MLSRYLAQEKGTFLNLYFGVHSIFNTSPPRAAFKTGLTDVVSLLCLASDVPIFFSHIWGKLGFDLTQYAKLIILTFQELSFLGMPGVSS